MESRGRREGGPGTWEEAQTGLDGFSLSLEAQTRTTLLLVTYPNVRYRLRHLHLRNSLIVSRLIFIYNLHLSLEGSVMTTDGPKDDPRKICPYCFHKPSKFGSAVSGDVSLKEIASFPFSIMNITSTLGLSLFAPRAEQLDECLDCGAWSVLCPACDRRHLVGPADIWRNIECRECKADFVVPWD